MQIFDEEEPKTYDPLISGLEPESYDTVFQELFSGMKTYFALEEPRKVEVPDQTHSFPLEEPSLALTSPDENLPESSNTFPTFMDDTAPPILTPIEPLPKARTRQYPMLRCGACTETFISQFALEHHEAKNHSELFGWFCSECDFHFDSLNQAADHTVVNHRERILPLFDNSIVSTRRMGMQAFMQAVTRRSAEFVKEFLITREKRTVMTSAYYAFAKCELQAVLAGTVGLVTFHKARTELLSIQSSAEHEDFVACLKNTFIYGFNIKRVPLITYSPPTTVYRTLTFNSQQPVKPKKAPTLRDVVSTMSETIRMPRYINPARMSPYGIIRPSSYEVLPNMRRCSPQVVLPGGQRQLVRRTEVVTPMTTTSPSYNPL